MPGDISDCHNQREEAATGILLVESKDTGEHPIGTQSSPTTENNLSQNVILQKVKRP